MWTQDSRTLSDSMYKSKETWAYCVLTLRVTTHPIYFCPLSHTTEKVKAFFSLSPYASFIYRCSMDSTSSQVDALETHAHCDCTTFYLIWCLCAQNYLLSVFPEPRFPEKRCLGFMSRITLSPSPFLAWWLRSFCAFLAIFFTFATICTEKIMVKPQLCHYLKDEHRKLCFRCTLKHLDLWHHL